MTTPGTGHPGIQSVCVFAGSSPGTDPAYLAAARSTGEVLAAHKITTVFGGGGMGLMGALADAGLEAGGRVIGVIPDQLIDRELGHARLTELRVVGSMHERKALMMELSDAFIALPGGAGTLEELSEVWTWAQLGIHRKPCGILNVKGYYAPFLGFLDHMVDNGFLTAEHRAMLFVESEPLALLDRMRRYRPPEVPRWLSRSEV